MHEKGIGDSRTVMALYLETLSTLKHHRDDILFTMAPLVSF